jgi:hypothetical protein
MFKDCYHVNHTGRGHLPHLNLNRRFYGARRPTKPFKNLVAENAQFFEKTLWPQSEANSRLLAKPKERNSNP